MPWCGSKFPDNKTLSKHIDDVHLGRGLLDELRLRFYLQRSQKLYSYLTVVNRFDIILTLFILSKVWSKFF